MDARQSPHQKDTIIFQRTYPHSPYATPHSIETGAFVCFQTFSKRPTDGRPIASLSEAPAPHIYYPGRAVLIVFLFAHLLFYFARRCVSLLVALGDSGNASFGVRWNDFPI